jgi:hypothetical protein
MTDQPTPRPAAVPDELVDAFMSARVGKVTDATKRAAREILAAVLPVHERQIREQVAAVIYAEARKWAANAQASSTVPERERRFAVAAALTKAATQAERSEA